MKNAPLYALLIVAGITALTVGTSREVVAQRGNITYDQLSSSSRKGTGSQIQMFGGGATTNGHAACYDANGNVIDCGLVPGSGTVTHTSGNLTSGQLIIGNGGADITFGDLSGDASTGGSTAVTVLNVHGVSYPATPSTHQLPLITASNTATYKTVPDCQDSSGNHLNYTQSSDSFSCGTSSSGGGGGGGWVILEQHTASSSSELDFTSCISSSYDDYRIELISMVPSTSTANLLLQMSTNGGSSYDTGSNYGYAYFVFQAAGGTGSGGNGSTTGIAVLVNQGTTANYSASGTLQLSNPGGSGYKTVNGTEFNRDSGAISSITAEMYIVSGTYLSTTAVNAFRLKPSSGTISSGTARCYGIAH